MPNRGAILTENKPRFAYFKQVAIGSGSGLMALILLIVASSFGAPVANPTNTPSTSASQTATPSDLFGC
ncbi:MAG: hypothetical protein RLZZ576_533 [Actinomycetota bacterium]